MTSQTSQTSGTSGGPHAIMLAEYLTAHPGATRDDIAAAMPDRFGAQRKGLSRHYRQIVRTGSGSTSVGRSTLRRALVHLESRGLVRRDGDMVFVDDPALLARWAAEARRRYEAEP